MRWWCLPLQVYELYNSSAVVVHYEVDAAPLQRLQEQNFHHPVLCCLTPRGEVRPGRTAQLEWIFSPLEAKVYNVSSFGLPYVYLTCFTFFFLAVT